MATKRKKNYLGLLTRLEDQENLSVVKENDKVVQQTPATGRLQTYTHRLNSTLPKTTTTKKTTTNTEEEDKKSTGWLQKGALSNFDDGYDFGDITKTILGGTLGTAADIGVGAVKGLSNIGEGFADLFIYGSAGVSDLFGKDDYADRLRKRASENTVDEWFAPVENVVNKQSFIGDKGDMITQGLGYVGGILATGGLGAAAGLGATGTTALTSGLIGLSAMGSGMSEAYQGGATDDEALKYGIISGVAEAGTELIFGGLGKAVNAVGLSKGLTSLDDALAKKISSKLTTQLSKNLAEYTVKAGAEGLEEVIAGFISSIGKEMTYMSEQDWLDTLKDEKLLDQFIIGTVTSAVAQAPGLVKTTKAGRDYITNRTQAEQQIIDQEVDKRVSEQEATGKKLNNKEITKIMEQVESDLEKGYISVSDIEDTFLAKDNAEIKALQERLETETDLKAKTDLQTLIDLNELTKQTNRENLIKENQLFQASYIEEAKKNESFEFDTTQELDQYTRRIYRDAKALDLNNTRKTHETIDLIAKLANDRGTNYRIVNADKLRELGYDERANGLVNDKGEVLINIESGKALNAVLGHETTHLFEGTDEYDQLQKFALEYAKKKGEYDTRLQSINRIYQGKNANPYNELTADIVGDYLFTDEQFINRLSTEKPNIFKQIYNYIKHVFKMATAGSAEARQLEQLKYKLEQAYKNTSKQANTDTKYSLSDNKTIQGLENYTIDEIKSITNDYIKEKLEESDLYYVVIKDLAIHGSRGRGTARADSDLDIVVEYDGDIREDSMFDILNEEPLEIGGITVDINPITATKTGTLAEYMERSNAYDKEVLSKGNTKYSLSDNKGRELSKGQQEFFKNVAPEVKDENGNLVTVYHTMTDKGQQFNEFNPTSTMFYRFGDQIVNYYTDNKHMSDSYARNSKPVKADTAKLNNIEEANEWLSSQEFKEWDERVSMKLEEENGNVKLRVYNKFGERISSYNYDSLDEALRRLKQDAKLVGHSEDIIGKYQYEGYVNITNPYVIDAQGQSWNTIERSFSQKLYDKYMSLTESEKNRLIDLVEWEDVGVFRDELTNAYELTKLENYRNDDEYIQELASIYKKLFVPNGVNDDIANMNTLFDVAASNFDDDIIRKFGAIHTLTTNDVVKKVLAENKKGANYDGVIIKNVVDYAMINRDMSPGNLYITFRENQFKAHDNLNPTEDKDIRYSLSEEDIDANINSSMTMEEAKDMVQRAFLLNGIYDWYDGKYKNGDEWLAGEGEDEVAMYIENTYQLQDKYLNKIYERDIGFGDDFLLESIVEAYKNGTLVGTEKQTAKRLDLSRKTNYQDNRFYAPQEIQAGKELYTKANQRVTNANRQEVYKARADFIIAAHNKGFAETMGLTQEEVGKKLKSWANYTKKAMDLSNSLNEGVASQNRWTGIENSSIVNTISISNEEMGKMVKEIKGDSSEWQRGYITSTMLALDTHIDYSNLTFEFEAGQQMSESALGQYFPDEETIRIRIAGQNTVAHEIGHYLDHKWAQDLGLGNKKSLTDRYLKTDHLSAEQKQFVQNFKLFVEDLENSSDLGSEYSRKNDYVQRTNEVFARFVGKFTEWVKNQATNNRYGYEDKWYKDKFTERQYREFVKLLQEKSMLDTTAQYSLSDPNNIAPTGSYNVYGYELQKQVEQAIAPLQEKINELTEQLAPVIKPTEPLNVMEKEYTPDSLTDKDIAPVVEDTTPEVGPDIETEAVASPFDNRDIDEVGKRSVKAYQYENPEVKPFFREAAEYMLSDLDNTIKGERIAIKDDAGYIIDWAGTARHTTEDIAYLKDKFGYSYEQIREGLNKIIQDDGLENNAVSKRIEFILDERLRNGYEDIAGYSIPANQDYVKLLEEKSITEYYSNRFKDMSDEQLLQMVQEANTDALPVQPTQDMPKIEKAPVMPIREEYEAIEPGDNHGYRMTRIKPDSEQQAEEHKAIAKVLVDEPATTNNRNKRKAAIIAANVLDKGLVFENLALKKGNRELQGKWDYTLTSEARAQNVIGNGHTRKGAHITKSLNEIRAKVENAGLTKEFYHYMYSKLNIDRMSLEARAQNKIKDLNAELVQASKTMNEQDFLKKKREIVRLIDKQNKVKNKPVFGDDVTAEISKGIVAHYEQQYPQFKEWAQDVYDYVNADRQLLVDKGVISQDTADLWSDMYPHYVPIRRVDKTANAINVPLDTGRTGVNAPIKKATGGNSDILPMFDTIAMRTIQTHKAAAKNSFGVELMHTIDPLTERRTADVDEVIDSVDAQEELLQEGKNGGYPTFTVFENGERITFEITQDMYDALKPISDSSLLSKTFKPLNTISNIHRGLLTEYNPIFMLKNAIKDAQDIILNSQHATKTYAKLPEAYAQILTKGYWYQEYMEHGGQQNSYFDSQDNNFTTEKKGITNWLPLRAISAMNNYIELAPRVAEYIASRESGVGIETAMLDAARVTTNFKAGGALTKFVNRNGGTFLNASVQGAMQQARNIREAHYNGAKGWANLLTKYALAGIPAMILNGLLWGDDDEYDELSDYVKQNYYIVAKGDDGTFVRIPKGRAVAVIQEALNQMGNVVTGNDEADLSSFLDLLLTNLAPNNPIESNIFSPLIQAATNTAWYGGDLVPTRLQDLPAAEQYDESTDSFSKWLGGILNVSPYKINYVLDQYSGGVGDLLLPMLTPRAENGSDSILGDILAPLNDQFTTNSTLNNQNITDFYDLSDDLTTGAKKSGATDEDILQNKYINSVKSKMNELYQLKREIQNSDLSDSKKHKQVLEVQEQINNLAREALTDYKGVTIKDNYSKVDDKEYYKNNEGEWTAVKAKEASELSSLNMTADEKDNYFAAKNRISDLSEDLESEERKVQIIDTVLNSGLNEEQMSYLYDKYYASTEKLNVVVKSGIGMGAYLDLEAQNFTADKDGEGKSISGSKKEKVFNYINQSDLSFEQKVILAKMYYPSYDEYNNEIIEYLNNNESLSYEDMEEILKALGFTVDSNGNIYWD